MDARGVYVRPSGMMKQACTIWLVETPAAVNHIIRRTRAYTQALSCSRLEVPISLHGKPTILSVAGLEEPGYAEFDSWLREKVAQFPALPARTWPFTRDATEAAVALATCDVGVVSPVEIV